MLHVVDVFPHHRAWPRAVRAAAAAAAALSSPPPSAPPPSPPPPAPPPPPPPPPPPSPPPPPAATASAAALAAAALASFVPSATTAAALATATLATATLSVASTACASLALASLTLAATATPTADPIQVLSTLDTLDLIEERLDAVRASVQQASHDRSRIFSPAASAVLLPNASLALTCDWVNEAHVKLETAVCLEMRESWALLAVLLPLLACVLVADIVVHHRYIIGTPAVQLKPFVPKELSQTSRKIIKRKEDLEAERAAKERAEAGATRTRGGAEASRCWSAHGASGSVRRSGYKPSVGFDSDFGSAFVNARVEQAERQKHFGSITGALPPQPKRVRLVCGGGGAA